MEIKAKHLFIGRLLLGTPRQSAPLVQHGPLQKRQPLYHRPWFPSSILSHFLYCICFYSFYFAKWEAENQTTTYDHGQSIFRVVDVQIVCRPVCHPGPHPHQQIDPHTSVSLTMNNTCANSCCIHCHAYNSSTSSKHMSDPTKYRDTIFSYCNKINFLSLNI